MRVLLWLSPVLLLTGCLPMQLLDPSSKDSTVLLVPSNPFSAPGPVKSTAAKVNYSAADKELAWRVEGIGSQILTANPQIGMKPRFAIYGTDKTEVFHTGSYLIHVTDGLVKKCHSDGEVAAVLALEMAEMVVEREALANPSMRTGDPRPPADVLIGHGIGSRDPEESRLAELAKFEKKKLQPGQVLPLPDPNKLARDYLQKAGYDPSEMDAVRKLLKEAEQTYILEKGYKQAGAPTGWAPAAPPPAKTTLPIPGKINVELPAAVEEESAAKTSATEPLWKAAPSPTPTPVPIWQPGKQ